MKEEEHTHGKTICFYSDVPMSFQGGGQTTSNYLISYLSKVFDVEYITDRDSKWYKRANTLNGSGFVTKQERFKDYSYLLKPLYHKLPDLMEDSIQQLNIVFIHRAIPRQFLKNSKDLNSKILFLMHGITFENRFSLDWRGIIIRIFNLIMIRLFKLAKAGLLDSNLYYQVFNEPQESLLKSVGVTNSHIFKIPTGIPFEEYSVGSNEKQFLVLYIGRIEHLVKGTDLLLKIAKKLLKRTEINIEFVVIGSGKSLSKIKKSKYSNVNVEGYVTDSRKLELLEKASLLIVTSRIEPFGLTLIEGLASGLPVVSTPTSGPKSILSLDSTFGDVSSYNVENITRSIEFYYTNWKQNPKHFNLEKLKRREVAKKYFDLSLCRKSYKDMITSIFKVGAE